MPKIKTSRQSRLMQLVKDFKAFKTDGDVLFCKICNIKIVAEKKSQVEQHVATSKHMEKEEKNKESLSQNFLSEMMGSNIDNKKFCIDLCKALISSDIPLYKLTNSHFSEFITKYTNFKVPNESTLRKNYLKPLFDEAISKIKHEIRDQYLWITIDETTDATGRFIANVVIGILSEDEQNSKKKFLLNMEILDKANSTTIARLFDDSVKILGENFNRDAILLFLSDAAPYMVKAAAAIKIFYPKILHVTCLAHAIHRVAEKIRSLFPDVDRVIASVKKVFLKAPSRIQMLKEIEPDLPIPPQPIITRWGTWLEAVKYYTQNFEKIQNVLNHLEEDSVAVATSKKMFSTQTVKLKNDLVFISSNYGFLASSITLLESGGLTLSSQIAIVEDATRKINNVIGTNCVEIKLKIKDVLRKNIDFEILKSISDILNGNTPANQPQYINAEIISYKFAPITSVDVERSFSMYKSVLRSNRQSFVFEHLKQYFIIYCNQNLNEN